MDAPHGTEVGATHPSRALALLSEVLNSRTLASEIPEDLARDRDFVELRETLIDFREFLLALSVGDLSRSFGRKGYLAGALKSLHSALRHLTWQTKMIATGDFSQRVDFMGEFSDAFNQMVQQLDESRHDLERISRTDALTGVNSRGYFLALLEGEVERSRRHHSSLSVMMFDLDHFKAVNDTHGHAAGDEALCAFVQVLQRSGLRMSDFWGRLGGEEFSLALPETSMDGAWKFAERIRSTLEETPIHHGPVTFGITVSIGISGYETGDTADSLLARADHAMYEAKQAGRNRICGYAAESGQSL